MPLSRTRSHASPSGDTIHNGIRTILLMVVAMLMASCLPTFDVDVNTPEPIKVDLSMDVHVYQHGKVDKETSERQASYRAAMDSRRNRMAEIQELKNNRLVGENHLGKLEIRNQPAGEYGEYVVKTVEAENEDRALLMKLEAAEKKVSIEEIREEQWLHWQRKSFPGEWVEIKTDNGYRWEQKKAASSANR
ncbi:MAG: DUF1318 domain-containing protein [Verrucomicrobiales bacterium]|nr:DUF1318 domain-containing protein [Verrucomicrobiales bacterium]